MTLKVSQAFVATAFVCVLFVLNVFWRNYNIELVRVRDGISGESVVGGRSPERSLWKNSPLHAGMPHNEHKHNMNTNINYNNNNHHVVQANVHHSINNNDDNSHRNKAREQDVSKQVVDVNSNEEENVFKTANLFAAALSDNTLRFKAQIQITEHRVAALDLTIFYREALPPTGHFTKGEIFLLHGQAFTSAVWLETEAIQTFAAAGYRVVAVDLPGYGQTSGRTLSAEEKPRLIEALLPALKLTQPVLVSPSMSGGYSIPFVIAHPSLLSAFVPVAPVGAGDVTPHMYRQCKLPTLIVYGERDTSLGILSASKLKDLPNSRVVKIAQAGHACYLNNPDAFHTVLLNFLDLVNSNN